MEEHAFDSRRHMTPGAPPYQDHHYQPRDVNLAGWGRSSVKIFTRRNIPIPSKAQAPSERLLLPLSYLHNINYYLHPGSHTDIVGYVRCRKPGRNAHIGLEVLREERGIYEEKRSIVVAPGRLCARSSESAGVSNSENHVLNPAPLHIKATITNQAT